MIEVGQLVKFKPFKGLCPTGMNSTDISYTGTVKYVNARNRWFSVEYGYPRMRISFNFNDVGNTVKVVKR